MGWSTGKDANATGKFAYELWGDEGIIHTVGGFATMQEADKAGGRANTNWLLYGITDPAMTLDDVLANLSDDELLAELLGEPNAMTNTFNLGDKVRIISNDRTGTIDRISDGIANIRTDDNISHFTAAFLTDLEPKP